MHKILSIVPALLAAGYLSGGWVSAAEAVLRPGVAFPHPLVAAGGAGVAPFASKETESLRGRDPVEKVYSVAITETEGRLASPALDPLERRRLESVVELYKRKLDEHRTNALLWSVLHQAQLDGKEKQIADAKSTLAAFLAKQISSIDHKEYPTNMSLAQVMAIYQRRGDHAHGSHSGATLIRAVLIGTILLAPAGFLIHLLRKHRRQRLERSS
jgi:hypothetical protein